MGWLDKLMGISEKEQPSAPLAMITKPIEVSNPSHDKIAHAMYRLDAICRYVDQTKTISDSKIREFRTEAYSLVQFLRVEDQITEAQGDAVLAKLYSQVKA